MTLDLEQLREAIKKSRRTHFRVIDHDDPKLGAAPDDAGSESARPAANLDVVRAKFERLFNESTAEHTISKSSQFVLLGRDDEDFSDDPIAPNRRIAVVSDDGEVVAEQG